MWGICPYNGILLELRLLSPYKGALPPPPPETPTPVEVAQNGDKSNNFW